MFIFPFRFAPGGLTLGSAGLKEGKKAPGERLPALTPVPDGVEFGKISLTDQDNSPKREPPLQVPETPSIFPPFAQRSAFRRRDARQEARKAMCVCFALITVSDWRRQTQLRARRCRLSRKCVSLRYEVGRGFPHSRLPDPSPEKQAQRRVIQRRTIPIYEVLLQLASSPDSANIGSYFFVSAA
jgi:hypothetical protein